MPRKCRIETFGCQMNVHDSERMAGLLEQAGFEMTDLDADADVILINTCSVRDNAEKKLYARLGELRNTGHQRGQRQLVAVAGCVAQQEGAKLLERSNLVDIVLGTHSLFRLPTLISEVEHRNAPAVDVAARDDASFSLGAVHRADPVRAYVTIMEGCNDFCTFCVVPHTRGRERMRPLADILTEVRQAVDTGHREIHLLGQIVNAYKAPDKEGCDFAELLARVSDIAGVERIRFASPHPRYVTTRLITAIRDLSKACKHMHLPVQSGSTRILTAMRRRHTREQYIELVAALRETVPGIAISTDMIVGFPGETAEDFEETLSLLDVIRYHSIFSFKYSPRPNTYAASRMADVVSEAEKTRRIMALQSAQRAIQLELHGQAVGGVVDVLVDSRSRRRDWEVSGRTSGNTVVNFPGDAAWIGRTLRVRIERAGPNSLRGAAEETSAA